MDELDLFVIGAGSGGVRAARMAAARGAKVAVAESRFFGGTCVNIGCVPKKLMVYAAAVRDTLAGAAGFGWRTEASFHWPTLIANKDQEIHRLNLVYERLLHGAGCTVLRGHARILDAHTVEVVADDGETTRYRAANILVATGGRPVRPTEPGTERAWISDDVFYLEKRPERLLVVGGGYIALEMASIFRGLGSQVTLAYRGPHVLRGFDDDVRAFLLEELRKKGIDVRLNTSVECLEDGPDSSMVAVLSHEETLEVDAALYAIGRVPNTEGLGLEAVGVDLAPSGAVVVDDLFRTSVPSIYALGDVVARLNLTPVALGEAMVLVDHLFGRGRPPIDYDKVPTAVFTLPPLAAVGLTEAEARVRCGKDAVHVYTSEFRPLAQTVAGGTERAFMKLVVEAATDRVLGVHLVGADAPEIIQGFAVALTCNATKAQLDATIGLHPTAAEELVTMRERRPDG
jgi:glutathione reductase (NADPH)